MGFQRFHSAAAGIEFHRQRYQLKDNDQGKQQNTNHLQHRADFRAAENQSQHKNQVPEPGTNLGNRNNGTANFNGDIALCMLHGMAALMRRYADCRN